MKYFTHILCTVTVILYGLTSCTKSDVQQEEPQPYVLSVPSNFPVFTDDADNPLTRQGVSLGRRLFYDTRLSSNNEVSCASCHHQNIAFSDGTALTSIGVAGTKLLRHSPALVNLAWTNNGLFWDGGSTNLESQAFGPLTAHDEMSQDLLQLVDELKSDADYPSLFRKAFDQEISATSIVKALAQFERTLISANSVYDKYVRKEIGGTMSPQALAGLLIVQQKCQGCHASDLFTDNNFHNNGLDDDFSNAEHEDIYKGRYRVSYNIAELGAYKTPTLRNVMLTAPYMHDGRFATIEQVLNHYASNVKTSASLSPLLQAGSNKPIGIQLSEAEKQHIIAFLNTLTDEQFITNKELSQP